MDALDGRDVAEHPEDFDVPEVLAAACGVLAVALECCEDGSDEALEICAAWDALDEFSDLRKLHEIGREYPHEAYVLVGLARKLLRRAMVRVEPPASAFILADALEHLNAATALLLGDPIEDDPLWD